MSNFTFSSSDEPLNKTDETNVLGQLRNIVSQKVTRPEIHIQVPERPGVYVRVSPNVSQNQMKAWRRNAGEDSKKGMDTVKFACQLIASTCTGILVNDEIVTNDKGIELTFASPEIMEMTGTTRPHPDCVTAFFGLEPHIESAAVAIIEAAGYGDNVESLDPTKTRSSN
jgi:hypothetical protein